MAQFTPEAAKQKHIAIARQGLAAFLARQQEKPAFTIEVDGRPASSENAVRPFGKIVYRFLRLPQIARYAKLTATDLSPSASGRYKRSWFLIVDGAEVADNRIPDNATQITLSNDQPYARKIHVRGARIQHVPPGIVERVRQMVLRRYGGLVDANIQFIALKGGHVLKRSRRGARRSSELRYPALVMTRRV